MIWDIGTGSLPSFHEQALVTNNSAAAFQGTVQDRAVVSGVSICHIYGGVDMTIPTGQVPRKLNITFVTEYMLVTVSVVAKRWCDLMLYNTFENLADEGALQTVETEWTDCV